MTWAGYKSSSNPPLTEKLRMMTANEIAQEGLHIGIDRRVYRRTSGKIVADVPAQVLGTETALLYTDDLDRSSLPPLGQIRHLFDDFMGKYSREILVWIGHDRKDPNKWHYMVPKQVGTGARVDYDDPDGSAAARLAAKARWVGSIHTHPGNSAHYSSVDSDNWRQRDCSGFHFIVARDHSYTICAVIGGNTWEIESGKLPEEAIPCDFDRADDLPLEDLLKEPVTTPVRYWENNRAYSASPSFERPSYDFGDYYGSRYNGGYNGKHYHDSRSRVELMEDVIDTNKWGWYDGNGVFHPWERDKELSKNARKKKAKWERRKGLILPAPKEAAGEKPFLHTNVEDYRSEIEEIEVGGLDPDPEDDWKLGEAEALMDLLREGGAIELTQGDDEFDIVIVGGRGFVVPASVMQEIMFLEEDTSLDPIEHHWVGSVDLKEGGINVHRE